MRDDRRTDADRGRAADRRGGRRHGRPSYASIREIAVAIEAAGLDSAWVFDHLLFRGDGETTRDPRVLDDPGGDRRGDQPGRARDDRDVHRLPQRRAAGQDGGHPRRGQRRAARSSGSGRAGTTRSTRRSATRPITRSAGSRRRSRSSRGSSATAGPTWTAVRHGARRRPAAAGPARTCRSSSRPRVRACSS